MKCNARPVLLGFNGSFDAGESVHRPLCVLDTGHEGSHHFRSFNDHPFLEVTSNVEVLVKDPTKLAFQKWTCQHCGARETMTEANRFYTSGQCGECGLTTDIVANGCNFILVMSSSVEAATVAKRVFKEGGSSGSVE